jgi:hypothetical protein
MANLNLDGTPKPCGHCGMWHAGSCPRIKSIEYYPDGTVRRLEYHDPNAGVRLPLYPRPGKKLHGQTGLTDWGC